MTLRSADLIARAPADQRAASGRAALGRRRRSASCCASGDSSSSADRTLWREGLAEARELLSYAQRQAAEATRHELVQSFLVTQSPQSEIWRKAKLEQLQRLLPGVDVFALSGREPRLLSLTTSANVVTNLLAIRKALPQVQNVAVLGESCPSLLWAEPESLRESLSVSLTCLRRWSPKSDAALIMENHPELIERIHRFYERADFHELPLELQNSMAVGGGGGGTSWQSWRGSQVDNNTD